jgi:hypothetical protein
MVAVVPAPEVQLGEVRARPSGAQMGIDVVGPSQRRREVGLGLRLAADGRE